MMKVKIMGVTAATSNLLLLKQWLHVCGYKTHCLFLFCGLQSKKNSSAKSCLAAKWLHSYMAM